MVAYIGKYHIEGNDLITALDVSRNKEWNGTEQLRDFKIAGDQLSFTTSPAPIPIFPDKCRYADAVFERKK